MRKLILASVSAIALFGVAACSDTDGTTTQSVEPPADQTQPMTPTDPAATPAPSADEPADPAQAPAPTE